MQLGISKIGLKDFSLVFNFLSFYSVFLHSKRRCCFFSLPLSPPLREKVAFAPIGDGRNKRNRKKEGETQGERETERERKKIEWRRDNGRGAEREIDK